MPNIPRALRPGRVAGEVALISGGLGGIGSAIALRLGQEGARIVLTDLASDTRAAASEAALAILAAEGIDAAFFSHDVREEASWAEVMAKILRRFGTLDVLDGVSP